MESVCKTYKMKFAVNCVLLIYKYLPPYSSKLLTMDWLRIVNNFNRKNLSLVLNVASNDQSMFKACIFSNKN